VTCKSWFSTLYNISNQIYTTCWVCRKKCGYVYWQFFFRLNFCFVKFAVHISLLKKCWSNCGKLICPYIEGEPALVKQGCLEQINTECPHVLLNIPQPPLKDQVKLVSYFLVTMVFLHCKIIDSCPCFHRHRQVLYVTVYPGFKNT
jgi:hypothetical protein